MKVNRKKIGERIKFLRKEWDFTQNELADKLMVKRQIISYYETGERIPCAEDLVRLAGIFSTTTDYILGLTDVIYGDIEMRTICDFTGLNETSINILRDAKNGESEVYNQLIHSVPKAIISFMERYKSFLRNKNEILELVNKEYEKALKDSSIKRLNDDVDIKVDELRGIDWELELNKFSLHHQFDKYVDSFVYEEKKSFEENLKKFNDIDRNIHMVFFERRRNNGNHKKEE